MLTIWKLIKKLTSNILCNLQAIIFSLVGFAFLYKSFDYLFFADNVANALLLFPAALISFAYANLSKFKKFEGLGFKAELWEDTKKEAEHIINKLKTILHISSAQIIETTVKSAYISTVVIWKDTWILFNKLEGELKAIDSNENLNETKKLIYGYFFWAVMRALANLNDKILDECLKDYVSIKKPKFEPGKGTILEYIEACQELTSEHSIDFDKQYIKKMQYLHEEHEKGNFIVDDVLIELADAYAWRT